MTFDLRAHSSQRSAVTNFLTAPRIGGRQRPWKKLHVYLAALADDILFPWVALWTWPAEEQRTIEVQFVGQLSCALQFAKMNWKDRTQPLFYLCISCEGSSSILLQCNVLLLLFWDYRQNIVREYCFCFFVFLKGLRVIFRIFYCTNSFFFFLEWNMQVLFMTWILWLRYSCWCDYQGSVGPLSLRQCLQCKSYMLSLCALFGSPYEKCMASSPSFIIVLKIGGGPLGAFAFLRRSWPPRHL